MIRACILFALTVAASASLAADRPRALAGVAGGEWSVSLSADGRRPSRFCASDPAQLALWEHRYERCRSAVISQQGNRVVMDYRCDSGGFGQSEIEVLTPRALRIDTQGISHNFPFRYVLHARFVGPCRKRR